jgi:hypothetical protein
MDATGRVGGNVAKSMHFAITRASAVMRLTKDSEGSSRTFRLPLTETMGDLRGSERSRKIRRLQWRHLVIVLMLRERMA